MADIERTSRGVEVPIRAHRPAEQPHQPEGDARPGATAAGIVVEHTPNPHTRKFLTPAPLHAGSGEEFRTARETGPSPLARRLFQVDGVSGVYFGPGFVAVSKAPEHPWHELEAAVSRCLAQHLDAASPGGTPPTAPDPAPAPPPAGDGDAPVVAAIRTLLDTRIRPAVARDGGDVVFHGFEQGVVTLQLRGACAGCPSSSVTLKLGIEKMLRHYIPQVSAVQALD